MTNEHSSTDMENAKAILFTILFLAATINTCHMTCARKTHNLTSDIT